MALAALAAVFGGILGQPAPAAAALPEAVEVPYDWGLIPDALGAGDEFRLLFITSPDRATSTDIEVYNAYMRTNADAADAHPEIKAYSSGFRVVGSTAAVDARDNTGTTYTNDDKGVPIYWLNGAKVADDYEDFYDGSWDDETNPKGRDGRQASKAKVVNVAGEQIDTYLQYLVWTGSLAAGTEALKLSGASRSFW